MKIQEGKAYQIGSRYVIYLRSNGSRSCLVLYYTMGGDCFTAKRKFVPTISPSYDEFNKLL